MRLIDADALKEEISDGKITIDEDVLGCESIHDVLVYMLAKLEILVMEKIDAQPTVETKYQEIVERLEHKSNRLKQVGLEMDSTTIDMAIEIVKEVGGMNESNNTL